MSEEPLQTVKYLIIFVTVRRPRYTAKKQGNVQEHGDRPTVKLSKSALVQQYDGRRWSTVERIWHM